MIACRKSFTDTLLELARQDKDIVAVTTDARGSVTLGDFAKELPAQFVECGIAEQDAVGISAGLAHSGKKVFVCGPACFYVARSLEQVKVDLAYSQNNVKILGVSGGVAYGALGATHHSLHDIAVLRTFPGMNIVLPCDARQTRKLVKLLVDYPEPVYVRVGRAAVPDVYENDDFDFILQESSVYADVPFPVIVVDDIGIQRDFPATVGHGTDILVLRQVHRGSIIDPRIRTGRKR